MTLAGLKRLCVHLECFRVGEVRPYQANEPSVVAITPEN